MRNSLLLLMIILLPCMAYSQGKGKITGKITDSSTRQGLEGATISVLNQKTGIFINYSVSGKKGDFEVNGLPQGVALEVIISLIGYADTSATITLDTKSKTFNTGDWKLTIAAKQLETVTVIGHKAPFVVRNDTLEFNANAFKSLPSDMVQDLLRKLPGMLIDAEGNVTMNGKKVNRIRVDGRDFFSGNLKVALENLPGSIIDKVQVMDSREKGTEHNSIIKPISDNLTINLTLKNDKKKGSFGNIAVGKGTAKRYSGSGFMNQFSGARQLAFTGNTGNISNTGMEIPQQAEGGLLKNVSGSGINLNDNLGQKGKIDVNYIFNHRAQPGETITERTNILPGGSFLYNSVSQNNAILSAHMISANYELPIDSLQQLTIGTMLSLSNNSNDARITATSTNLDGTLINSQDNHNNSPGKTVGINSHITYNRSSRDHKTNFTVNWSVNVQQGRGKRSTQSQNIYYTPVYQTETLNQQGSDNSNNFSNNLSLNLSHELSSKWTTILNYTLLQNLDIVDRDIFNYNVSNGKFDQLDSLYSNHNRNEGFTHLPSASLGYKGKKISVELGAGYRISDQQNHILWTNSLIKVNQNDFSPHLSTSVELTKNSSWVSNYSVESTAPTAEQLSPVQDNTNPLYIKVGNPALRSSLTHNIGTELKYYSRDYKWQASFLGRGTLTNNQIAEDTYYDSLGRQFSTLRNVNGIRHLSMQATGSSRFKLNAWNIFVNLAGGLVNSRNTSIVNHELNIGNTVMFTPQVNINIQYKDLLFLQAVGSVQYYSIHYTLQDMAGLQYEIKKLSAAARLVPLKRLEINSNLNYTFNGRLPVTFQRSRTLVNASISYNFLKSEQLTVGLLVNDLLNNNTNLNRRITPTAIETVQTVAIRRYGMLTLKYRFNHFSGK